MHWVDVYAEKLLSRGKSHVVESGTSISGQPHLGSAMDIVIADGICKAIKEKGGSSRSIWAMDVMDGLRKIESPHVKEIRGKGLLIGVELKPESGPARPFCEKLMERGMLCKETHESVIRFAPPLVIERQDIDWALGEIRQVLS